MCVSLGNLCKRRKKEAERASAAALDPPGGVYEDTLTRISGMNWNARTGQGPISGTKGPTWRSEAGHVPQVIGIATVWRTAKFGPEAVLPARMSKTKKLSQEHSFFERCEVKPGSLSWRFV